MFFTNIIQEDFANIEIFMLNSNPSPDRLPHNMKHKMGISNFVLYKWTHRIWFIHPYPYQRDNLNKLTLIPPCLVFSPALALHCYICYWTIESIADAVCNFSQWNQQKYLVCTRNRNFRQDLGAGAIAIRNLEPWFLT